MHLKVGVAGVSSDNVYLISSNLDNGISSDLLGAFNDQDLDNPTEIDFKAKERISRTSGKGIDEVSKLLVNYKQSLIVQQWLVLK